MEEAQRIAKEARCLDAPPPPTGFTSSTSFANPAVTLARGFTTTFAGTPAIQPNGSRQRLDPDASYRKPVAAGLTGPLLQIARDLVDAGLYTGFVLVAAGRARSAGRTDRVVADLDR